MRQVYKIILVVAIFIIVATLFYQNQEEYKSIDRFNLSKFKRAYQLEYNTTIEIDNSYKDSFIFKSKIDMRTFNYQNQDIIAVSFINPKIDKPKLQKVYFKLLNKMIFIKILPDGTIDKFYFYYDEDNYSNIKQIFYTLETILKKDKKYYINQRDLNGVIEVLYTRDKDTIIKRKIKYNSADIKIVSSNIHIDIDNRWIINLQGEERYIIDLKNTKVKNRFNFKKIKDNKDTLFELSTNKLVDIFQSYNREKKTDLIQEIQKEKIIKKIKNTPLDINETITNISYHIQANSDEAKRIKEIIRNSKDRKLRVKLIEVLRKSSTPQAQEVLMEISMDDEFAKSDRLDALSSLGLVENPKDDLTDFLLDTYYNKDDLFSSTAILAVGNLYHHIQDKEKQQEIISTIKDEYANKTKSNIPILRSMENIDSSIFKDEIYSSIDSGNFFEQYNAISIASNINTPETKTKLLNIINNPKADKKLREIAIKSLRRLSSH